MPSLLSYAVSPSNVSTGGRNHMTQGVQEQVGFITAIESERGQLAEKSKWGIEGLCRAYGAREIYVSGFPALTRWAKLCRAYGALARLGPDAVVDTLRAISRVRHSLTARFSLLNFHGA
jgi:hypothetical protein